MSLHSIGKPLALGRKGAKPSQLSLLIILPLHKKAMALPGWWAGVLALKRSSPNTEGMRSEAEKPAGLGHSNPSKAEHYLLQI